MYIVSYFLHNLCISSCVYWVKLEQSITQQAFPFHQKQHLLVSEIFRFGIDLDDVRWCHAFIITVVDSILISNHGIRWRSLFWDCCRCFNTITFVLFWLTLSSTHPSSVPFLLCNQKQYRVFFLCNPFVTSVSNYQQATSPNCRGCIVLIF